MLTDYCVSMLDSIVNGKKDGCENMFFRAFNTLILYTPLHLKKNQLQLLVLVFRFYTQYIKTSIKCGALF